MLPFVRREKNRLQSKKHLVCCAPIANVGERKLKRIAMKSVFHIAAKPCTSRNYRDAGHLALREPVRLDGFTFID